MTRPSSASWVPQKKLWDEFARHIAEEYGLTTEEWGFYKTLAAIEMAN
jgi:hypothetical protein